MTETPTISNYAYSSTTWCGEPPVSNIGTLSADPFNPDITALMAEGQAKRIAQQFTIHRPYPSLSGLDPQPIPVMSTPRRLVKVIIADTDPNVPLEQCLLYSGTETFTDATDQELFFEIPIKDILDKHNAKRVQFLDKEATKKSGKDVKLEPVRIRHLKMVVVEIAKFA